MPIYEYQCEACNFEFEKILPMSRYTDPQNCPECAKGPAKRLITGGNGFILKGEGWTSRDSRVAGHMASRRKVLEKKTLEQKNDAGIRLTPNVGGEVTDSWSDAAKLARSQGKDDSGYTKRARAEVKK